MGAGILLQALDHPPYPWMRNIRQDEDRLRGRAIELALSGLRHGALNVLRHLGHRYIPDGWRAMAARADRGLALLKGCWITGKPWPAD